MNMMKVLKDQAQGNLPLTPRETEIMNLLTTGLINKQIAWHLKIETETVKSHLKNIYPKLNARNRVEAMIKYHRIRINLLGISEN